MVKKTKVQITWRYLFSLAVLVLGLLLTSFEVGGEFLGFSSVGTWLIYIALVMFAVFTLQLFANKKRIVDERMNLIAFKTSRVTFVMILLSAFLVMIIDGVKPIEVPYHMFMSYLICYMILVYAISYKILEGFN
jgi:uncharacterized membrane protein